MEDQQPYGIFDYSELPLIKISYTGAKATDETFTAYLKEMETFFERAERYVILLDTTKAAFLSVKHRIMQGKQIEKNQEHMQNQSIAAIFVAPTFLHKTVLKAIFLVKPYPSKVFFVDTKEEGVEKANELLENEKYINTQN